MLSSPSSAFSKYLPVYKWNQNEKLKCLELISILPLWYDLNLALMDGMELHPPECMIIIPVILECLCLYRVSDVCMNRLHTAWIRLSLQSSEWRSSSRGALRSGETFLHLSCHSKRGEYKSTRDVSVSHFYRVFYADWSLIKSIWMSGFNTTKCEECPAGWIGAVYPCSKWT